MNPADLIERLAASVAQYPPVATSRATAGGLFSTSTCPCTLPAGIGIVGYVGTHAERTAPRAADGSGEGPRRGGRGIARSGVTLSGVAVPFAFFVGLVLALTALGTAASVVGRLLTQWGAIFATGAAVVAGMAGVATLLAPALRRRLPDPDIRQRRGVAGAFLYGVLYSVATLTTSAGPLLLLLTVATAVGRPLYGGALSLAYALGRGAPFLALGLFAGHLGRWLERVERARRPAEVVSGLALLGVALYFARLATVV